MQLGVEELWQHCLQTLRQDIEETEYQQWLLPLVASVQDDALVLDAINAYFVKHIEKNYLDKITALTKEYSQGVVTVVYVRVRQSVEPSKPIKSTKVGVQLDVSDQINPAYTFDVFVRGKSNTLAYNACYDMAKKGAESSYGSLFIYGVPGVGKSHLMQAVAHRYQRAGKKICYFSADGFMQKVARAFLENAIGNFQKSVNEAELLIIDDVHKMPSNKKPQMANVLLGLYSDFTQHGKRVILTSDKLPMQMEGFDARFLSRFSGGLTVAIDPPEMETRVQILEKKAALLGLVLPKECAIFIAQNTSPDVRQLEGALNNIHAHATLLGLGQVVDIGLVSQALKSHIVARARSINSDSIKDMVAEYFGISVKDLVGKKRARNIARPRQIAMALTREFTNDSFPDIGQAFGGRDHSTVIHACEKVVELMKEDPVFEKDYKALATTLEFS